jgi:5-methylcytosine-specific restriction endonuclease McrA
MSWFNFYNKKVNLELSQLMGKIIYEFDEDAKARDDALEHEWRMNRGNVPCYDDITGLPISPKELQELEDERSDMMTPQIIIPDESGILARATPKMNRKYKPRKTISKELRLVVYQLHDSRCARCHGDGANQIHHKDNDATNNNIKNLQLVCYDCHLIIEGKEKFRIV